MTQGYFDEGEATKAVRFIESLKHTKGRWAGRPFKLATSFQREPIRQIFGRMNADGTRQLRRAFLSLPRKNGKTELVAAVGLKLLFADREPEAEIYSAAASRDQASLTFNVAASMVRGDARLRRRAKIIESSRRIVVPKTGSFWRAIPAEAGASHGLNAHAVLADELHAWKGAAGRELWEALTTSTGARAQPLIFAITTAGYDRESICYEEYEYARRVLQGVVSDPTYFAAIYEPPESYDWQDIKLWRRMNPAIKAGFRSLDEMKAEARRAREMPARQNAFRRLYLNDWRTQQASRWIDLALWDENAQENGRLHPIDDEHLKGRRPYGGLDLGAVDDLTAWLIVFPHDDDLERIDVLARFWCPESKLNDPSNRYRDQYRLWARQGWLKTTPGDATDYAFVRAQILEDAAKYRLVDMGVDRLFQAHQLAMELADEGIVVAGMGQGFLGMAAPMAELQRRLLARKLHHGGNPVLRWMADNVAVKQDAAGNLKPDKSESQGKIDGIPALAMALDRAMRHQELPAWRAV